MKSYLYLIHNDFDQSVYIGKTVNLSQRWHDHCTRATNENFVSPLLHEAMFTHGIDHFSMIELASYEDEESAYRVEAWLIWELWKDGYVLYNMSHGGRGARHLREEDRVRHSQIQKEWSNTTEARSKNSRAQRHPRTVSKKRKKMLVNWQDPQKAAIWRSALGSEGNRKFQSERQTAAWEDPILRQKIIAGMNDPAFKQMQSMTRSNEGNPRAKLSWEDVERIRTLAVGGISTNEIHEVHFPWISYPTLRRVISKRGWIRR